MRSLINTLLPHIALATKRNITPYQSFLLNEKRFIDEHVILFKQGQGHESGGTRILRYILSFIDFDYLITQTDNYKRYTDHIRYAYDDIIFSFDKSQNGKPYYNKFIGLNNQYTREYILPVTDTNCIVNLPMYSESWGDWKYIKPVRLWSHNSDEFTINLLNSYIAFHSQYPSVAIILIDVVALILKYVIWFKYYRDQEAAQDLATYAPQQFFIHKYVLCNLAYDLGDIWLIRTLNRLLNVTDRDELQLFQAHILQEDPQFGYITAECGNGFQHLWDLCNQTKTNSNPQSFLNTRLLFSGSIHRRIIKTEAQFELPSIGRYDWCRILRDADLILLYLRIWYMQKNLPICTRIITKLRYELDNIKRARITKYIYDLETKLIVDQKIAELDMMIKAFDRN